MTQFVVDANVAIKWVLPEIHSEIALKLLDDDNELLVPDFFWLFWTGYDILVQNNPCKYYLARLTRIQKSNFSKKAFCFFWIPCYLRG